MSEVQTLISHTLCPYVQRAAIVLSEKSAPFDRIYIDLADKPEWFQKASPLGKVPLLKTGEGRYLFESAPIVEYLDETQPGRLHPDQPVERARHRAYVEFASQVLNGIGSLYNAKHKQDFEAAKAALRLNFCHLEEQIDPEGPFFAGDPFSLVDAAFAPVFRYFDVLDDFVDLKVLDGLENTEKWRQHLAKRPSVVTAVAETYQEDLRAFLRRRDSWLSYLLKQSDIAASATAKH
ncbi:glutathione S-transferase family protein [uncultured Roseibium sp.]|uniref:glutathione S-transferase family protein n=1 Tax=uncultured Roseibium sp. TaxID=1936171 RepID=UPI0026212C58|nr:glutathione S-transferase family protein [uncultured Roseibium sp.]